MDFDFDAWFEGFWVMYHPDLCKGKAALKGGKITAKDAARKKVKDEKTAKQMMADLAEQKNYFNECMRNNQDHPRFPMVSTWFNQSRWSVDIDSHSELKEKIKRQSCRCGGEVVVNYKDGGKCIDCHNKHYEKHDWRYKMCREKYKEMILDQQDSGTAWELSKAMTKAFLAKNKY